VILVDTSIWIELLNGRLGGHVDQEQLLRFAVCGPVVQEVLQGLRPSAASAKARDSLLAMPRLSEPLPLALFLDAAEVYREGRRRGVTIRSSIDCLIAAIAIANGVPVWHKDRDYEHIARYTSLLIFRGS
jgi:predicted nucleic acid-binding protein